MKECGAHEEFSLVHWLFNRIIEWFELEEIIKGHLFKFPCNEEGHLQLHQVLGVQSRLTLSVSRDRASTTSLGNLCQCLTALIENFFLILNLNFSSFSLNPFLLIPLQQTQLKSLSPRPSRTGQTCEGKAPSVNWINGNCWCRKRGTRLSFICLFCSVNTARDPSDIIKGIWVYMGYWCCNSSTYTFADHSLWLALWVESLFALISLHSW